MYVSVSDFWLDLYQCINCKHIFVPQLYQRGHEPVPETIPNISWKLWSCMQLQSLTAVVVYSSNTGSISAYVLLIHWSSYNPSVKVFQVVWGVVSDSACCWCRTHYNDGMYCMNGDLVITWFSCKPFISTHSTSQVLTAWGMLILQFPSPSYNVLNLAHWNNEDTSLTWNLCDTNLHRLGGGAQISLLMVFIPAW